MKIKLQENIREISDLKFMIEEQSHIVEEEQRNSQ